METNGEPQACDTNKNRANCDMECWVMDRISDAIEMAVALDRLYRGGPRANEWLYNSAINGLVNGAAAEIIKTLNMEPEYTNINSFYLRLRSHKDPRCIPTPK